LKELEMNKAIKISAREAAPYRRVLALIDQWHDHLRVFVEPGADSEEDALKPPAAVHLKEQVDQATGVVTRLYRWGSVRLDVVPARLYQVYLDQLAKREAEPDRVKKAEYLNAATRVQIRTFVFRCQDDNGGFYWGLSNGTKLLAEEFTVDHALGVNLTEGAEGALRVTQCSPATAAEVAHLTVDNSAKIRDGIHRGYFPLNVDDEFGVPNSIHEDVPEKATA
jgi:hypothetical protein